MTPGFSNQAKSLGFTPLELAQLLDNQKLVKILKPGQPKKIIKVMHEGDTELLKYDLDHLRRVLGVRYLSHLKFSDYDQLKEVINQCPFMLRTWIGNENRELGEKYRQQLVEGFIADVTIKWIDDEMGYGVFANQDLPEGTYIGEYTGLVRHLIRGQQDYNAYSFHYPTRFWSWNYFIIDAMHEGNELRFLNHSNQTNLKPMCLVDRGLLHMAFLTNQSITAGTELTFDYGIDYWRHRQMRK